MLLVVTLLVCWQLRVVQVLFENNLGNRTLTRKCRVPSLVNRAVELNQVAILQSILRLSSTAKQWARYALTSAGVVVPVFLQRCFEEGLEV